MSSTLRTVTTSVLLFVAISASAAVAPVLDSFTASPAAPLPGQSVQLRIDVHDPDCTAGTCTSGCGALIRPDLLVFSDNTGRTPSPFTAIQKPASFCSPMSATADWLAPSAEGTYTISASVSDNGGSLCGGKKTSVFTLQVTVSSARPPAVDSCTVTPSAVPAGGTATISATGSDPLGRPLTWAFTADAGTVAQPSPESSTATWTAPASAGSVIVRCQLLAGGSTAIAQTTASVEIGAFLRRLETNELAITRVAPLSDGRFAAVDGVNGILAVLDTQGALSWKKSGLGSPVAVAVSGGEIFALERRASRISVWSTSGQRLRELPVTVSLPNQLVAGPGPGELALTDTDEATIVVLSSSTGTVLRVLGRGVLQNPTGLAARDGRLAVADAGAAVVYVFSEAGVISKTIGGSSTFVRPQGVAWDAAGGRIIVADSFTGELKIVGEEGSERGALGGFGTAAGQLINPVDVALLPGGTLAVPTGSGALPLYQLLTTLAPLRAPAAVVAEDKAGDDGGAVAVRWTLSADDPVRVTGYRIERAAGQDEAFQVVGTVARGTSSFVDTSAVTGTCYRYRVAATEGTGDAFADPTACARALNDLPPAAPQNPFAEADSPFAAWVEWDPVAAPDLSGYVVDFVSAGSAVSVQASLPSVAVSGLQPGTGYTVAVRAVDTAGNRSEPATLALSTWPDAAPPSPTSVAAADAATSGEIRVSWTAPESTVPVDRYRVECTPAVSGWPAPVVETSATETRITGLVNSLEYRVSVVSLTAWDRAGEPSTPVAVTPTTAARLLPLVDATGEPQDVSGIAVRFAVEADHRQLRFQYRSSGTLLQPSIDGVPAGQPLPDSGGAWTDGAVDIDKRLLKGDGPHLLELRSTAFPSAGTVLALRRIDLVPLPPLAIGWDGWNSVVDLTWRWQEWRQDLGVALLRDGSPVACHAPQLGRCRDTFLENDRKSVWTLAVISPAGWAGPAGETQGHAKFEEGPPPVTDLLVVPAEGGMVQLSWTPLSAAPSKNATPVTVRSYRVYVAGALAAEVLAPPAVLAAVDPASIVVRSVDAEGRESR